MATRQRDVQRYGKNIVGVVLSATTTSVVDLGVMVHCENSCACPGRKGRHYRLSGSHFTPFLGRG